MDNIEQFIFLFDSINIDHTDIIISLEIFKSFLFNKSIQILNDNDTLYEFIDIF